MTAAQSIQRRRKGSVRISAALSCSLPLGLGLLLLLNVRLPPLGSLSYPLVALGDLEHSPPGFGINNLIGHRSRLGSAFPPMLWIV
jgi:hypothetical protein